jgi:hypothetical protein
MSNCFSSAHLLLLNLSNWDTLLNFLLCYGSWCRYKVPNGCDLLQVGGLPVVFGTSHVGLVHRANLQAGQVAERFQIFYCSLMSCEAAGF